MTNKKAIKILKYRKRCIVCVADCNCDECDNAFDTAIKALEQDDVLDKIRADIEKLKIEDNSHNICFKVHNDVAESVLRIIDKYKTESEG